MDNMLHVANTMMPIDPPVGLKLMKPAFVSLIGVGAQQCIGQSLPALTPKGWSDPFLGEWIVARDWRLEDGQVSKNKIALFHHSVLTRLLIHSVSCT